jgi:hypothetical protein
MRARRVGVKPTHAGLAGDAATALLHGYGGMITRFRGSVNVKRNFYNSSPSH